MEAKEALLSALDLRWARYRAELKNCHKEFSEGAVHDLRVESRRLLAIFDMLRAVINLEQIQKVRRELKSRLDEMDELRDVQVLLVDVLETIDEFPDLKPFQKHLQKREKKLLKSAQKLIDKESVDSLSKRVKKTREQVEELTDLLVRSKMFAAIDESYVRVMNRYAEVDSQSAASIHRLRIAFKRFRYMVEIIHPLVENFPDGNFERMHTYQTLMGEIQDVDLALQYLSDLREAKPELTFDAAYQAYQNRLELALSNYLDKHNEASYFWRTTPSQPFPWEL